MRVRMSMCRLEQTYDDGAEGDIVGTPNGCCGMMNVVWIGAMYAGRMVAVAVASTGAEDCSAC